jgi:hypothetical protein
VSLYNPERASPLVASTVVQVERHLPHPGEVLVRVGSRVEPEDIVARAFVPAPPQVVNVAQALSIPAAQLEEVMRYSVGAKVEKGVTLASAGALGGACPSPIKGIIATVDTGTGYVTVAPDPLEFELNAALRGVVMEVHAYRGVVIESPAAQVYGAFGVGLERVGVLRLLVTDPTEIITADFIDARSAYSILIGGSGITAEALRSAVQAQVRGVGVGSIDEQELRAFLGQASAQPWQTGVEGWRLPNMPPTADPGLTILVTEGFGSYPMAQPMFDLLSSRDQQEAFIEGSTNLRRWLYRPRLIMPFGRVGAGTIETPRPQPQPGATVRLLDRAHLGQIARVVAVATIPHRMETGLRAPAVEVVQEGAAPFWVPRTAIEVLA